MKYLILALSLFGNFALATSPNENCFIDKNLKLIVYGQPSHLFAEIELQYQTYMSHVEPSEKYTVDFFLSPSGSNNKTAKLYISHFSNNDTHSLYEKRLVQVVTKYMEKLEDGSVQELYSEVERPQVYSMGQDRIIAPVVCYQFAD